MINSQSQLQLLIPEYGIMNGFCYTFSKRLAEKLRLLIGEQRLIDKENCNLLTPIASAVILTLRDQTYIDSPINPKDVNIFLECVEEYLSMFKNNS